MSDDFDQIRNLLFAQISYLLFAYFLFAAFVESKFKFTRRLRFQNPSYHRFEGLFRLEDGDGARGRALVGHLEARRQLVSHEGPTIPEGHLRKQYCQRDAAKGREDEYEEKWIFWLNLSQKKESNPPCSARQ